MEVQSQHSKFGNTHSYSASFNQPEQIGDKDDVHVSLDTPHKGTKIFNPDGQLQNQQPMEERDTLKAGVGADTSIARIMQGGRDTLKQEDFEEQSKDKQAQFKNLFSYFKNKKGCSPIQEESSPGS